MAPFKLKFRMGGSRSTSQEHDPDPQVNEALLNHHQQQQHGTSTSTLDSADGNSLASLGVNSERRSLLPNMASSNKTNNFRLGYLNQSTTNETDSLTSESATTVPSTPPPSYEHVLKELQNTQISSQTTPQHHQNSQSNSAHENSEESSNHRQSSRRSSANSIQQQHSNPMDQIYEIVTCNDPNCEENIAYNERQRLQREQETNFDCSGNGGDGSGGDGCSGGGSGSGENNNRNDVNYENAGNNTRNMTENERNYEESLLNDGCNGDCQQYGDGDDYENGACGGGRDNSGRNENSAGGHRNGNDNDDFPDPLMNRGGYYDNVHHNNQHATNSGNQDMGYNRTNDHQEYQHQQQHQQQQNLHHQQQQQHHQQQQQQQQERIVTPEYISNKSSKEMYKDLAKQWGITCKMSDGCRCMECQSHYFDCEFDDNEHQKTDGGLGAGTPMFISEVMHGSACHIL